MAVDNLALDSEQPWQQLTSDGENDRWYSRFLIYRDMGPVRSILGAAKIEAQRLKKDEPRATPHGWREKAKEFAWAERAKAWDEYRRQEVWTEGYAYDVTRVKKLNTIAQALENRIVRGFLNAKEPKGVNPDLIDLWLKTLDAIAQETGGRKKALELSGKVDSEITALQRVVFVMPERGDLASDIEQMTAVEGEQC